VTSNGVLSAAALWCITRSHESSPRPPHNADLMRRMRLREQHRISHGPGPSDVRRLTCGTNAASPSIRCTPKVTEIEMTELHAAAYTPLGLLFCHSNDHTPRRLDRFFPSRQINSSLSATTWLQSGHGRY